MKKFGFVANTLVHTPGGMIRIQDVRVGDQVLSQTEGGPVISRSIAQVHQPISMRQSSR